LKKQFSAEDFTMILQWIVALALTPFVLLPLFPGTGVSFTLRLLIIIGGFVGTVVMTLVYLKARSVSHRAAVWVVDITAGLDVILIFVAMLLWPDYLPDLFWVFPLLVIVVANRFGYRQAALAAISLSALYSLTLFARLGGTTPARTVVGDTLIRVVFLLLIALATSFISQRERRVRRDARILSRLAASMASTLEVDGLMDKVVQGISEAAGLGRCSAFLIGPDGRWALPQSTTEASPKVRERFFGRRIDLGEENVATVAMRTGEPLVVTDPAGDPLLDRSWTKDFDLAALLVLPFMVRDEPRGVIFVERRGGMKNYFLDREVNICGTILAQASSGFENALSYAEEQKMRAESDIRYRTSRELSATLDIERVVDNACKLAMRSIGTAGGALFLTDERRDLLEPVVSIGAGEARRTSFPPGSSIGVRMFEDMYELAERPASLRLTSPSENQAVPPFLRSEGSMMMAPFFMHGRISGLLCCTDAEEKSFTDAEASQLAAIAGETALAVMNARLHERIKSDAVQMASLVQLANTIGSSAELSTIMRLALETVRHLFDCTSGLIYRIEEDDGTLRCEESFGYPTEIVEKIQSPPYPLAEECWTVAEDRLICLDDLEVTEVSCGTLERIGKGSTICVGMQAEGKTLGVLHVRSEMPEAFNEQDQQLALAIADQVGLAIQRAILFEEINRLAATDALTGVFNVRRLEAVLSEEVSRARRYDRPVAFLMVDVDNLKAYNDTLGHQQGDIALSQIASIIDSSTRDVDKVFRYGGDEFCVVLPETAAEEAAVVAEKVRRAVAEFHFAGEEKIPGRAVTISVGLASFPGEATGESELIGQADIALYAAKQRGRNSVAAAG
jgi:diguanylate cyclase (GGDEF)-like protein